MTVDRRVYEEGRAAGVAGRSLTCCPYPPLTDAAAAWQRGWARATGVHPLDLTRRRVARAQERTVPDPGDELAGARPLAEWPEPLRTVIETRLRTPNFDDDGWCRWCHAGVKVPHAERDGRPGTSEYRRVRAYRSPAALARHEAECRKNPDARCYMERGAGFTVTADGQMAGWYASPAALVSMRQIMGHLRSL